VIAPDSEPDALWVGLDYSTQSGRAVHVFQPRYGLSRIHIISGVARVLRNLCAAVGPQEINIISQENILGAYKERILSSCFMVSPAGNSIMTAVHDWRGHPSSLHFSAGSPRHLRERKCVPSPAIPRKANNPYLVINIGQSEIKVFLHGSTQNYSLLLARSTPRRHTRAQDIFQEIQFAINQIERHIDPVVRGNCTVLFSVSSSVHHRSISPYPNGFTKLLCKNEIKKLKLLLGALPRRAGYRNEPIEFLNDGYLSAMAHTDPSNLGKTLTLRSGSSLCGGLDAEEFLGEIGWLALPPSEQFPTDFRRPLDQVRLARDFVSAESLAQLNSEDRFELLSRVLPTLVAELRRFHEIQRVVLCGTLLTEIRSKSREALLSRKIFDSVRGVSFSQHKDQKAILLAGIRKFLEIGAPNADFLEQ
jgi:hypothetical protein